MIAKYSIPEATLNDRAAGFDAGMFAIERIDDGQHGAPGDQDFTAAPTIASNSEAASNSNQTESFVDAAILLEGNGGPASLDHILSAIEKREILKALSDTHGQRTRAAQLLGISRSRLYRRMEALGIGADLGAVTTGA